MPTEIEIDTIINTDRSNDGLKKLNKGLKDLVSLQSQVASGSDQFKKLQTAINETESKIGDLKDGLNTLRGSGVERTTASLALLQEGFATADPEKLAIGMEGLGAAMKAIPIFLLIQGAQYLFENWSKLTAIFSESAKQEKLNEEALKDLNEQVAINRVRTDELLISKNSELKAIERQGNAYEQIIEKIKEIDLLTQSKLRDDLSLTDKEIQNQIQKINNLKSAFENKTETESFLQLLGIDSGVTEKDLKEAERALTELAVKRGEANNKIISDTADTADKLAELEKQIRDRDEQTRRTVADLRIQDISKDEEKELAARLEGYKEAQYDNQNNNEVLKALSIAYYNDVTDIQKKYGSQRAQIASDFRNSEQKYQEDNAQYQLEQEQKNNQKLIQVYKDQIDAEAYLRDAFAKQDEQVNSENESKQNNDYRNRLAFQQAFQQESLQQKIEFINQDRDTQLLNEDLTQKQRIAIIEKSENDILQLKVKKGEEYLSYAKSGADILNGLNQLQTQSQNYELQQQEYTKDAAIQNDTNRTQEKIDNEQAYTNQLLSNDNLTSDQRNQITQNSENRQKKITQDSKNAQLSLASDFSKKEIAIRKQQFEKQKAIQIVTGVINTAAAVLQTIATVPYPANIPLAILAGAAGAIQVGIIANQQFDDGGAAANSTVAPVSTSGGGSGSFSGGGGNTAPSFNPQAISGGFKTDANQTEIEKAREQKVYVLESDIRSTMGKVDVFESRATFGG